MKANPLFGFFAIFTGAIILVQVIIYGAIATALVCGALWLIHHFNK